MIDVVEVKTEIKSGNLVTEMHERSGKKYLILKDTKSGESVCVWMEGGAEHETYLQRGLREAHAGGLLPAM